MSGTTYKRLDRGSVEDRAKVVIDAVYKLGWVVTLKEDGHWLVDVETLADPVKLPPDLINYMLVQDIFTHDLPGRLQ